MLVRRTKKLCWIESDRFFPRTPECIIDSPEISGRNSAGNSDPDRGHGKISSVLVTPLMNGRHGLCLPRLELNGRKHGSKGCWIFESSTDEATGQIEGTLRF